MIRRSRSSSGKAQLRVHHVGPHPILRHYLAEMNASGIIRSCLGAARQGEVDHAMVVLALVHNLLVSPGPLYRLAEWLKGIEPESLGLSAEQVTAINDDRAARALDALASRRGRNIMFRLALRVIKRFGLDTSRVHFDTTAVTLYGEYAVSDAAPKVARGRNASRRPDLKQLMFGLNAVADGAVPIAHGVYSGNRSDDSVQRGNWQGLSELLGKSDFIYVADSKLCTKDNLALIASSGGKFVTVLPRSRSEDKRFRAKLKEEPARWRKLLERPPRRLGDPPDVYSSCAGPDLTDDGYRLIWIKSSAKAERDAATRERHLAEARRELLELSGKLNRSKLKDKAAIKTAAKDIIRKHRCEHLLKVHVKSHQVITTKYLRRGRPKAGDPVKEVAQTRYTLDVTIDEQARRLERRVDGVFPLVTNLYEAPKREILLIYKYQAYLEKRFALFKGDLSVAPVYLKKPSRIMGLLQVYFIAMIVAALIERSVRHGMEQANVASLPLLPEARHTATPTAPRILEAFKDVCWYEFEGPSESATFAIELTPLQEQLLQLLHVPRALYT